MKETRKEYSMAEIIRCAVVRIQILKERGGNEAGPEKSSQRREAESAETEGCETSDTISGGHNEGVPPVPIPNTEVKPFSAESTWLETAREDRSLPDSNTEARKSFFFYVFSNQERG